MFGWRRGIVYAYSAIDPVTGLREHWAYVGQTRQELALRHAQHMGLDKRQKRQPWSDLYPEIRVVFEFKACPDWWLNLVEKWTIKFTYPKYNYMHNLTNPNRIPLPEAERARVERDRKRRVLRPGWISARVDS
jgi:hypothetical protein